MKRARTHTNNVMEFPFESTTDYIATTYVNYSFHQHRHAAYLSIVRLEYIVAIYKNKVKSN